MAPIVLAALLLAAPASAGPAPRIVDPAIWFRQESEAGDHWPHRWPGRAVSSFRVSVGADGRVTDCSIVKSSGYESLDRATCSALLRRGRFYPARNAAGEAVAGQWSGQALWTEPEAGEQGDGGPTETGEGAKNGPGCPLSPGS